MKLFTIFGKPVSHSRSPLMHNSFFKAVGFNGVYIRSYLKTAENMRSIFKNYQLSGANITVPYKEDAYKICDEVRGIAKDIKAVNTIINIDNKLIGFNTDAEGFYLSIKQFLPIKNILIIGAGGTAKAISYYLKNKDLDITILNRSENRLKDFKEMGIKNYSWVNFKYLPYQMIINTTSAGLQNDDLPLDKAFLVQLLKTSKIAIDVIYGKPTPFLNLAKTLSVKTKDGADMLLLQGVLANQLFLNKKYSQEETISYMKNSFFI